MISPGYAGPMRRRREFCYRFRHFMIISTNGCKFFCEPSLWTRLVPGHGENSGLTRGVIGLYDVLVGMICWKTAMPAGRTNQTKSAAKWHLVHSVAGKSEHQIKCTAERKHESCVLKIGDWVKDQLLLDPCYFSPALFDRIHQRGEFFISRLKKGCPPIWAAVHQGDVTSEKTEVLGQTTIGHRIFSAGRHSKSRKPGISSLMWLIYWSSSSMHISLLNSIWPTGP